MSSIKCEWCGAEAADVSAPCPSCGLSPKKTKVAKKNTADPTGKKQSKDRRFIQRTEPWDMTPKGQQVIGVDPGAQYTGIVVRDGDAVLHASTLVRPSKDTTPLEFARFVVNFLRDELVPQFPNALMGVEGVSDPKGYNRGQRASINPKYVMRMAVVAGGVAVAFPDAVEIPPGGNGTQHISQYPDCLIGRRPKDLPGSNKGAGTRSHEQSAYDVAGKAAEILFGEKEKKSE